MKGKLAVLVTIIFLLPIAQNARALCWGVGAIGGSGNFDAKAKPYFGPSLKTSGDFKSSGVLLLVDYSCDSAQPVSVRAGIAFTHADLESADFTKSESLETISFDAAIPFTLYDGSTLRFWLGPQFRMGHVAGTGSFWTRDVAATTVGLGVESGMNIHLGKSVDLCVTAGVRGDMFNQAYMMYSSRGALEGSSTTAFATLNLLYRAGDGN